MVIMETDIEYRFSGGVSNSVNTASLGGTISSVAVPANMSEGLFDNVNEDESTAGDMEYRCIYVRNGHATLTWMNVRLWITMNTPSNDDTIAVGLDPAALNANAASVANENTAPTGVTFTSPVDKATGLSLGNIPPGGRRAVWFRRTVNANAGAVNANGFTIRTEGGSTA